MSQTIILVGSNVLGQGEDELGRVLMRSLIKTILAQEPRPAAMIFVNTGVQLTCSGSELLGELMLINEAGVELLSCGTCLDYFNLRSELKAGKVTNMGTIVSRLMAASSVIRL